ncbi:MAG: GNAT family N-acetyltransferase [Leucobacter sp.]
MAPIPNGYSLHSARGLEVMPALLLHDIGKLRQEVFVIEQQCIYLDFDGRDAEPGTMQYWIRAHGGEIAATLRVLNEGASEPGLLAIGRVATNRVHRGNGLAAALIEAVVLGHGENPLVLEAQSHLTGWYGRFGFVACGSEYLEDGIPHTPMRREPGNT